MEKKILTIGDIHGRDTWKFLTHGSSYEFDTWQIMVMNGAKGDDPIFNDDYPFMKFDKIIFIGDYVDSFTVSNIVIKKNLEDIIFFKQNIQDKVILLWGNHDVQYFIKNQICSGYRSLMQFDLEDIFRRNMNLFQMAYKYKDHLWTHAGLVKQILRALKKEGAYDFLKGITDEAEILNEAFVHQCPEIFSVDSASGGFSKYGGPLWVRPKQLCDEGINLNQIIGHTPQKKLAELETKNKNKIWIVDYLEYNEDKDIEPFILNL